MEMSSKALPRECMMRKHGSLKSCNNLKEEEDRLSSLPDGLLHQIMSFMNTKLAVQTCVLSKRWKSLWKSLPYLDFNLETFPFKADAGKIERDKPRLEAFVNFISQVLLQRRDTNLVKVSFRSLEVVPQPLVDYAVAHNVQQLTFQSGISLIGRNPWDFLGCPNLETLKLHNVSTWKDTTQIINAHNLKRFELTFQPGIRFVASYRCKIVINAPKLTTLQYSGYARIVCSPNEIASIDDAYIDIYDCTNSGLVADKEHLDESFDKHREYVLDWITNLKRFRHAKSLTLSWETVLALAMFPSLLAENQVPFANLRCLKIKLKEGPCRNFEMPGCVLNYFLNSSTSIKLCW